MKTITFFCVLQIIQLQICRKQNRLLQCSEQLIASERIGLVGRTTMCSKSLFLMQLLAPQQEENHSPQTFISVPSYVHRQAKFWVAPRSALHSTEGKGTGAMRRALSQAAHVGITPVLWSSWGLSAWTLIGDAHLACLAQYRLRSVFNKSPKQRFIGLKEYCNHTKFIK